MSLLSQSLSENRRTLALAAPIVSGYLGQMLMGWADTIMVGRVGVVPLAACAFANTVLAVPFVFGFGLLSSVSVKTSHAHGAGAHEVAGQTLRAGLLLALLAGILAATIVCLGLPLLPWLGQKPEVNTSCVTFLVLVAWSVVPLFLTAVAKGFCEALSRPWVPFWIIIGGVLINVGLNWIFIYGNLGCPAMGLNGAGWATLLARILTVWALAYYLWSSKVLRINLPRHWLAPGIVTHLRGLLRIGLPTGAQHLCEVTGFAFGSIMMGWLSIDALAAHQIAITCAATSFMVPLGLGLAVSVRVGQARGSKDLRRCQPIILGALGSVTVFSCIMAALFILGGTTISSWFSTDHALIALSAHLLLMAGFFQVFDGLQVVSSGTLRGFEDTRFPMYIGILAYWIVALPFCYFFAFTLKIGPTGVWMGFVLGLGVAAVALMTRVFNRIKTTQISIP